MNQRLRILYIACRFWGMSAPVLFWPAYVLGQSAVGYTILLSQLSAMAFWFHGLATGVEEAQP